LLRAIRDAAHECELARRWEDAANLYRSGIELDSLNEGLYRGLMLCHQELGDHSEALAGLQALPRVADALSRDSAQRKTQALFHSVRERAAYAPVGSAL